MLKNKPPDVARLIKGLESITKNRCSLSVDDVNLLKECIRLLKTIRKKPDKQGQRIVSNVVGILMRVFKDDIHDLLDKII